MAVCLAPAPMMWGGGFGGWGNRGNGNPVTEAGLYNAMNFNDLENAVGRGFDQQTQFAFQTQRDMCTSTAALVREICCSDATRTLVLTGTNSNVTNVAVVVEKEFLEEKLEEYMNRPMTDSVAEHLNVYHGARKALCMLDKQDDEAAAMTADAPAEKVVRTPELDGDTEFEKILMEIPIDAAHIKAVYNIFADHMAQLAIVNRRSYDNIMLKL